MNVFRRNVLVLLGAALLIAMSVGSALGAKPTSSDTSRGQTISAFVHSLISGDQHVTVDEGTSDEAPAGEDATETEDSRPAGEDATETEDSTTTKDSTNSTDTADLAPGDSTAVTDANAHGTCVSEVAQGTDTGGDNDNHGGAVSLAARETCWNTTAATDSRHTAADVQVEMAAREAAAAKRAAAKEARKADKALTKETRGAEHAASIHGKSADHRGGHGRP